MYQLFHLSRVWTCQMETRSCQKGSKYQDPLPHTMADHLRYQAYPRKHTEQLQEMLNQLGIEDHTLDQGNQLRVLGEVHQEESKDGSWLHKDIGRREHTKTLPRIIPQHSIMRRTHLRYQQPQNSLRVRVIRCSKEGNLIGLLILIQVSNHRIWLLRVYLMMK